MAPEGPSSDEPVSAGGGQAAPALEMGLEGCYATELLSAVASEWADPYVHEDFRARSLAPSTVDVFLRIVDCKRVIMNGTVVHDVFWMDARVAAYQDFDDSSPAGTSVVVDTFVSNEGISQRLAELGIDHHVASIERYNEPTPLQGAVRGWRVYSSDFSFDFQFPEMYTESARGQFESASWYAGPAHLRLMAHFDEMKAYITEFDVVPIQMEGDTNMNKLFGNNPSWTFAQQTRWDSAYSYEFQGGFSV